MMPEATNSDLLLPRRTQAVDGWTLHSYSTLPSTNPVAGALPAWHAVRADIQTHGHGRTGRTWVSDAGGLWLSAVLPTPGPRQQWAILPLAAGWAAIESLRKIGVTGLRLRWPNDIMAGRRKLAGLLVEQFHPETAVIGIGVNVANQPHRTDPALGNISITLDELAEHHRSLDELTLLLLRAFRDMQLALLHNGFADMAGRINAHWTRSGLVELSLNGREAPVRGSFQGIDAEGRLWFTDPGGSLHTLEASQVALLREVD